MSGGATFELDYNTSVVFLKGNLSEGYTAHGPYPDHLDAWVAHDADEGWTMTITESLPVFGERDDLAANEIEPGTEAVDAILLVGEISHGFTIAGIYRDLDAAEADDRDSQAIAASLKRALSGPFTGKEVARLTIAVAAAP